MIVRAEPPPALTRAFDELRGDRLRALLIAIAIGVLVGFLVSSLIAIRVRRLARAAEQMAAGRFDAPLPPGGGDEIGDLTRSLDTMREELRKTFSMLATERDRLSAIFDGLTEAVIVVGEDGAVRFTNPAAARLVRNGQPAPALIPSLRRAAEQRLGRDPRAPDRRPRLRRAGAPGSGRARGAAGGPRPDRGAQARAGGARVRLQRGARAAQPAGRRS